LNILLSHTHKVVKLIFRVPLQLEDRSALEVFLKKELDEAAIAEKYFPPI